VHTLDRCKCGLVPGSEVDVSTLKKICAARGSSAAGSNGSARMKETPQERSDRIKRVQEMSLWAQECTRSGAEVRN
jgi:hypothetical protein